MKFSAKLKNALLSALFCSVTIATVVSADDTEIFFGQSDDVLKTNPNVLFILDTSGSMEKFDGTPTARIDRLKIAMRVLLQESSSFNVGLMGFSGSDRGGSIRHPIGDLESDSNNACPNGICPDERVVVKPHSSSDDATQNNDTNVVTLNADSLIMANIDGTANAAPTVAPIGTTRSTIATSISAETELSGGVINSRAVTGTNKWFYNETIPGVEERYAYRFNRVKIPKGATVTSAYLTFYKSDPNAQVGNLSTQIKLEVTPNADQLPNQTNTEPSIAFRLATQGLTTNGVSWDNVPPDTTGTTTPDPNANDTSVRSPDLSDIINQVVSLPDWQWLNPLSFILDPADEYIASDQDVREFLGLNTGNSLKPRLTYTFSNTIDSELSSIETIATAHLDEITEQNSGAVSRNLSNPSARAFFAEAENFPRKLAFRFDDIDIPQDAEIQTAILVLTGGENGSESNATNWSLDPSTGTTVGGNTTGSNPTDPSTGNASDPSNNTAGAQENILSININAEKSGTPAPYANAPLETRDLTSEFLPWEDLDIKPGEEIASPNLANVVASVINGNQWSAGDDLSLVLTAPSSYNNVLDSSALIQTAAGTAKPSLFISWKRVDTTTTTESKKQTTALRFENVHVPPGAEITSAKLVFEADKATIGDVELEISAEDVSSSPPLTGEFNDIGDRTLTKQRVNWNVEPWDIPNVEYDSPEIIDIIEAITHSPEWCGGNPLTILINKLSGTDSRHAVSFDQNQVAAPRLEITYSPENVTTGAYCSNATLVESISSTSNDAVQDMDTSIVDSASASLDTLSASGSDQVIGLRFIGIDIPQNAAIVSAELELTHEKEITAADVQAYEVKLVSAINGPVFSNSDAGKIVSNERPTYPASVTASVTPGPAQTSVFKVDIATMLREKLADPEWVPGKHLVLTVDGLNNNISNSFYSIESSEVLAPRLNIYYQSERESTSTVVRDRLIEIVDSLEPKSGTPIVGAYYEGVQYLLGNPIDYGLIRGNQTTRDIYHRVSHPTSYINGTVFRPSGCSEADLNSTRCITETIRPAGGLTPTYIAPENTECQQNHIVILSDGKPTSNSAAGKIRNLTGSTCVDSGDEECGQELASWLLNTDLNPAVAGKQKVTTHTIGFNLTDPRFLKKLSTAGGGGFHEAQSSAELLTAFRSIFNSVSKTDTSFVSPGATVSQSNRLKNRDDLYFSLFKPEGTARWAGNLKRYRLGGTVDDTADIYDANGSLAVDSITGRFFDSAKSFWSNVVDGDSTERGGAAEKIETNNGMSHLSRNVYTYTGINTDLTAAENQLLPTNSDLDRTLLKLPATLASNNEYVTNMLNWAHGRDEFDIDGDSDTEEARAQMGDPLHSQPLIVNYADGKSVVHIATNEGFLHAIDSDTGNENYAFMPKELWPNIRKNYENEPTRNRTYGLDGAMTLWIDDANKDGLVDSSTDRAYLYFGMRRGGSNYYALDVTEPKNPKYLWSIQGGTQQASQDTTTNDTTVADGDFSNLGDSWSKPLKTKIYNNNDIVDVLVFGAGYGVNQDPTNAGGIDPDDPTIDTRQKREEDQVGLGFFVVDARTGDHIYEPDVNIDYQDMMYSVPSDLRVIDINFDGLVDQIYFGDMGGQVWRFDYNNDQAIDESVDLRMSGGRIGAFAGDTPETARRFYYPPDVAVVSIEGQQQLSVSIGSGWRAHPLDEVVEDRFYNIRQTQIFGAPQDEDGKVRYAPPIGEGTTGMIELNDSDVARTASVDDRGWFLPLRVGEKTLSSAATLDGDLVFTTYNPSAPNNSCDAAVGGGSVYILDAATGNPVQNLDVDPSTTNNGTEDLSDLDGNDRYRKLPSSGIPPGPTILFPEIGDATTFSGGTKLEEVQIESLRENTFWHEFAEENF